MQNSYSLTAGLLKALYFPNEHFLNAALGNRPSQIWRAILDGQSWREQGLIKRTGNGESTSIWEHNWIPRDGGWGCDTCSGVPDDEVFGVTTPLGCAGR